MTAIRLTSRDDDDDEQDDDTNDQPHAHLHVLPPHLLADTVGAATEALSRSGEVVGLVLQRVETLSSLRDLVDVFSHHTNGVIDLLPSDVSGLQHRTAIFKTGICVDSTHSGSR